MKRRTAVLFLLAAVVAATLVAAPAQARLVVGLGDQKADTFSDPNFRRLGVNRTRLIVPWNAINKPAERAQVDEWMRADRKSVV